MGRNAEKGRRGGLAEGDRFGAAVDFSAFIV
jgi:hypothetical protein